MSEDATPVAIVVRFTLREGAEAEFDELVARTVTGIRAHEPGTIVYAVHSVEGAPRERMFYELYRDRGALSDHSVQPHTRQFMTERERLLEARQADFLALADGKVPFWPPQMQGASGPMKENVSGE